jgi:hypothetical protein
MPRRPKLVTQFLENIHRKAFDDHPELIRMLTRQRSGIYALFRKDELYYVGLATDLRWRVKHHLKDRHKDSWDRFSVFLTIGDQHLRELETLAIRIMKPVGNKQIGRFAGAQNLDLTLRRLIDAKNRRARDLMLGRPVKAVDDEEESPAKRFRHLRGRYKKKAYRGRLLKSGTVRVGQTVYSSLSSASTAICGHPVNGRWFWHVERSPGDWVRIRDL